MTGDQIFLGFMIIMAIGLASIAIVVPLWVFLHHKLSRLDYLLLREPFFKKAEQINCMIWPLSYLKTVNYIGLIAVPRYAKKVRFKDFDDHLPVSNATVIACKVQFWLMVFCGLLGIVYFGYGAFFLYLYPRFH